MKSAWQNDLGILVLRLVIGTIAAYYGSQKLFGFFGGMGFHSTIHSMEAGFGIPPVFGILAIAGEFAGGLGLIFGFLTRIAAFGFACTMAVATFENWITPGLLQHVFSRPAPSEPAKMFFSFALFGSAVAVLLIGPGRFSLDARLLGGRKRSSKVAK